MADMQADARQRQALQVELVKLQPQFQLALPKAMNADRFTRILVTSAAREPKLLECDRTSFYQAAMTAAQLGLYCDGVIGDAYLIPYGKQVQCIPGYKGLLKLVRRSGEIGAVGAQVVYEGDLFRHRKGDRESIEHEDMPGGGDGRPLVAAYAVAHFRAGGEPQRAVMHAWEIEKIREGSPGKNSKPWKENTAEMYKKTVLRRLCKTLPMTAEAETALAVAEAYDHGRHAAIIDGVVVHDDPPPPARAATQAGTSRLRQAKDRQADTGASGGQGGGQGGGGTAGRETGAGGAGGPAGDRPGDV
jgi:recombination protein RecT